MKILTPRLLLRDYDPEDWRALDAVAHDPAISRWFPWGPAGGEQTRRHVAVLAAQAAERPRQYYDLVVLLREEARLIGSCFLHLRGLHSPEASLAYFVGGEFAGHGYATEAAGGLVRFGIERLGLQRILAYCEPENAASVRVLEKLGMRPQEPVPDAGAHGPGTESVLYTISAEQWRACG